MTAPFRTLCLSLTSLLFLLLAIPARPADLQEVTLPPVPSAPSRLDLTGTLDGWTSIDGYLYSPLSMLSNSGGKSSIDSLLADPVSVKLKTCYDSSAFYVAAEWRDRAPGANSTAPGDAAHWSDGGEGLALHIRAARVLHLACWPVAGGKTLATMIRAGAQPDWQSSPQITAACAVTPDGKGFTEEIRIPWTLLTGAAQPPADGKLDFGADFVWNALPASILPDLRAAQLASVGICPGVSYCYLTARPSLINLRREVGGNPVDWGDLAFGSPATGDQSTTDPIGNISLSVLPVPLVPPALQPPSVDGNSAGWPASAFQSANYLGALWGNRFASHYAAQYDAGNLYLCASFSSFAPPVNYRTERTQAGFNGGDALQVRLTDGRQKINLCGWFDTQSGKPAFTADGKDVPQPFLLNAGARESFRVSPDGRGYLQQIAIPWKLLFGKAPAPGARIKATLQPWFADTNPQFSLYSQLTLQQGAATRVSYKMPADGQLTLGLYNKNGELLRWLAQDEFRYAGNNQEPWDGLDQWGNPLPAGTYSLKGIYHPALAAEYKMSYCNPGTPPWPTPDDKGDWMSDEADPQAAVTDGKWVFLGAPGCEKGYAVIGVDETGQRQWGMRVPLNPHCMTMALAGDYLYVLFTGPELTGTQQRYFTGSNAVGSCILMCLDKRTGQPALFTKDNPALHPLTWPYRDEEFQMATLRNTKAFTPSDYAGQPRYARIDIAESDNPLGMAAAAGKLYVSLFYDNKIAVLDAATGKPTGDEIEVPAPVGLCALDDHTLLAVSGTTVVKVDLVSKSVTPVVTSGLVAPDSVCVDKSGNIYVSDWKTSFQVKVFSPSGAPLHAIGTPGGRPWVGPWDKNGMLVPRGVAVTDDNKLWVAEDDGSPKRVSVWNAATGDFIRDYIGPTPYAGATYFWVDPKDSSVMHTEGTRFKVDLDNKTWVPTAIDYRRQSVDDPFTPIGHALDASAQVKIMYRDGHEYAVVNSPVGLTIMIKENGIYRSVAAFGEVHRDPNLQALNGDGTERSNRDGGAGMRIYYNFFPPFFRGHYTQTGPDSRHRIGDLFSWSDTNGDRLVQASEMHWVSGTNAIYTPGAHGQIVSFWGNDVSSDWTYYYAEYFRDRIDIMKVPLKGWTSSGAPIYDIADATPIVVDKPTYGINSIHVTDDNKLIVARDYENGKCPNALDCYDLQGRHLWGVAMPKEFHGKNVNANNIMLDLHSPQLGDIVCTSSYHGSIRPYLLTSDGLYIGTLFDSDTRLGPTALWGESQVYFYQTPDGYYAVNGGNQSEHIFKFTGLDGPAAGRFEGTFQLTDADVQKAAAALHMTGAKPAPKPLLAVTWLSSPPQIDGTLSDWNLSEGVSLDGGNSRTADIALGRDAHNLYLAYKVHELTPPLTNGGADWRTLFASGDCVDLMLQTDPKADPHRHAAVAGDERLLFSLFQGQPVAVLYRPVAPGAPGASASADIGSAHFDQIIRLDSAKVAVTRNPALGTYTVEASVPLNDLGIDPSQNTDLRGDVGVVFADESGKSRSLRLYFYNHHTEMLNDVPTESTLQPGEWGPLLMPLGRNLLRNGSFESPLVPTADLMDQGWFVDRAEGGTDASIASECSYTGLHSLRFQTLAPPVLTGDPAHDGRGVAEISQIVPVSGGHLYSLRFHYRSEDAIPLGRTAGGGPNSPYGFVGFGGRITWRCLPPAKSSQIGTYSYFNPAFFDWKLACDERSWDLQAPYQAPTGTVAATISFSLQTKAPKILPKIYLDDVEFVDVTPVAG